MDGEFVPLTEIVDVDSEYNEFLDDLKERINDLDVPDWILIPKRASGEHATGNAWLGVVLSICGGKDADGQIDTRVAIDTDDRDRVQSNVGDVPEAILNPIREGIKTLEREVNICVARMNYDTETRNLEDLELLFLLEELEEPETEDEQ